MGGDFCEMACYMEPNCVSYNLRKEASDHGKHKCELNNSTFEGNEHILKNHPKFVYRGAKVSDGLSSNGSIFRINNDGKKKPTQRLFTIYRQTLEIPFGM